MKVVINTCFGGFGLSTEALYKCVKENKTSLIDAHQYGDTSFCTDWDNFVRTQLTEQYKEYKTNRFGGYYLYNEQNRILYDWKWSIRTNDRTNPDLIALIEELGESANGEFAKLKIVEIPDNIEYYIDEYDGYESVHEQHQSWD